MTLKKGKGIQEVFKKYFQVLKKTEIMLAAKTSSSEYYSELQHMFWWVKLFSPIQQTMLLLEVVSFIIISRNVVLGDTWEFMNLRGVNNYSTFWGQFQGVLNNFLLNYFKVNLRRITDTIWFEI